jgi:hypothetical protein
LQEGLVRRRRICCTQQSRKRERPVNTADLVGGVFSPQFYWGFLFFCLTLAGTCPPQVDLSTVLSGVALAKTEAMAKVDGDAISLF